MSNLIIEEGKSDYFPRKEKPFHKFQLTDLDYHISFKHTDEKS